MISFLSKRRRIGLRFLVAMALVSSAGSHGPVPENVFAPKSAAEAWNVIRLSTANVGRLLQEGRLAEVPDQVSLCSPSLRALPQWSDGPAAAEQAIKASLAVSSLAQASVAGDRVTAQNALVSFKEILGKLALSYDPETVRADIFTCPMHPDVINVDPQARCDKCGMGLIPRRIPYSFVYAAPGESTLQLSARAAENPAAGRPLLVTIRLSRRDGSPVRLPDLLVMHTQPIHLLIVDGTLEDYHHEHPMPTDVPGEYAFSFTPAKTAPYRIFADVVPVDTGLQEYPFADLPAGAAPDKSPPLTRPNHFVSTAGGLKFTLSFTAPDNELPKASRIQSLRVTVSDEAGAPALKLEPVMNAFAHLVGFYDDRRTVVHLHPVGLDALAPTARGGPELDFNFFPPRAGLLRLYCQVQAGGRMIFAPFDLNVAP